MDINTKLLDTLEEKMDNFVTEKQELRYSCIYCDSEWSTKFNYSRHLKTEKHKNKWIKSKKMVENEQKNGYLLQKSEFVLQNIVGVIDETPSDVLSMKNVTNYHIKQNIKNIETRYCCDYCQFSTTVKKESNEHRKSKQPIMNENKEEDFLEIVTQYVCLSCDKKYDKYKSCWEHIRRCKGKPVFSSDVLPETNIVLEIVEHTPSVPVPASMDLETIKNEIYKEVCDSFIDKILENNNQLVEKILESNQQITLKIAETMSQSQHALVQTSNSNNNNNTINNNQQCTINMFLNEKCKDAINITDWVDNLVIDFEHLHYNAENGFQKGLTKMLIDNLKLYNVSKRPIHFTDVKRETMYIKDADEWTKHENHDKLIEVLETGARQGIQCFAEWMEENTPAYHNLDSQLGQQYMAIHQNVIRPHTERMKAYPKVVKEVARAAQLRKEDQTSPMTVGHL